MRGWSKMTATKSDKQIFEDWQGNSPMGSFSKGRVLNFMKMARQEERKRIYADMSKVIFDGVV